MTINSLSISYPDFKLLETMNPEEFDTNNSELVTKINAIKDVVNKLTDSTLDTDSGADNISITAIAPFISTKLQSYLEEVVNQLQSTTDADSGADFIASTAITGVTGATVQAQLESLKALLDSAKTDITTNATNLSNHKGAAILDHPNSSVTTAKVKDANITTAKIADLNVTSGKLANNSVIEAKIIDGAVSTNKLSNGAVTDAKILTGTLDNRYYTETEINAMIGGEMMTVQTSNIFPTTPTNGTVVYLTANDGDGKAHNFYQYQNGAWRLIPNSAMLDKQTASLSNGANTFTTDRSSGIALEKLGVRTRINHTGYQGKFESDYNQWDSNLTFDTSIALFGASSGKIDNSAGTTIKTSMNAQKMHLSGKYVLVGAWAKAASGTPTILLRLFGYDATDSNTSAPYTTKTIDSTWKFYYFKIDLTANTEEYWKAQLRVNSWGTADDVVNFDGEIVYELTSAEYSRAHTQAEIEAEYPYVDTIKGTEGIVVERESRNKNKPFSSWELHANATITGAYDLELVATADWQSSEIEMNALGSQAYTLNVLVNDLRTSSSDTAGAHISIFEYDSNGTQITSYAVYSQTYSFTTNANTRSVKVQFTNKGAGTYTFSNPCLNIGSTAIAFEPYNADYAFISSKDGQGFYKGDLIYAVENRLEQEKNNEFVDLDGSLGWVFHADDVGFKRMRVDNILKGTYTQGAGNVVKHDGKILSRNTDGWIADSFQIGSSNSSFYVAVSDPDSGWTEAMSPTANMIKGYMNGWKYTGDGTTHSWAQINDATVTSTSATFIADPANSHADWIPYKLLYERSTPSYVDLGVIEGLSAHEGTNVIRLYQGVVVREAVTPQLNTEAGGDFYQINRQDIVDSYTNYRLHEFLEFYKGNEKDTSNWTISTSVAGNGNERAIIEPAKFDTTAQYYVTYIALNYQISAPVQSATITYEASINGVVGRLVQDTADNRQSIVDLDRVKANIAQENFIKPTLLNGHTAHSENKGYYKDDMGVVHVNLRIKIGTGASGTIVFYFPKGYRLSTQQRFPLTVRNNSLAESGTCYIDRATLRLGQAFTSGYDISIQGSFRADQ